MIFREVGSPDDAGLLRAITELVEQRVRELVGLGEEPGVPLGIDTPLLMPEGLQIEPVELLILMTELEAEFELSFEEYSGDELIEAFQSIRSIALFIHRARSERSARPT